MEQLIAEIDKTKLQNYVDNLEQLEHDKSVVAQDIRGVYEAMEAHGFDVKVIRSILKLRKMDREQALQHQELIDLYFNYLK